MTEKNSDTKAKAAVTFISWHMDIFEYLTDEHI